MSDAIHKLAELFVQFPGIGPRQAKRFVYFLLGQDESYVKNLLGGIKELRSEVSQCRSCFRHYVGRRGICGLCSDPHIEQDKLLVVEKDADLESIHKTGKYHGQYFVLGGLVPILEKEPELRIKIADLRTRLKNSPELKEVILALSANPAGENTAEYLRNEISKFRNLEISTLGRGLSTGSELEYADSATLSSALESRKSV